MQVTVSQWMRRQTPIWRRYPFLVSSLFLAFFFLFNFFPCVVDIRHRHRKGHSSLVLLETNFFFWKPWNFSCRDNIHIGQYPICLSRQFVCCAWRCQFVVLCWHVREVVSKTNPNNNNHRSLAALTIVGMDVAPGVGYYSLGRRWRSGQPQIHTLGKASLLLLCIKVHKPRQRASWRFLSNYNWTRSKHSFVLFCSSSSEALCGSLYFSYSSHDWLRTAKNQEETARRTRSLAFLILCIHTHTTLYRYIVCV